MVSPFIVEIQGFVGITLILLVLSDAVVCEEFEHKISTASWVNLSLRYFEKRFLTISINGTHDPVRQTTTPEE